LGLESFYPFISTHKVSIDYEDTTRIFSFANAQRLVVDFSNGVGGKYAYRDVVNLGTENLYLDCNYVNLAFERIITHQDKESFTDAISSNFFTEFINASGDNESLVSDPVDTATGAFTSSINTLAIQGGADLSLPISYYSSILNEGSLGVGWEHAYNANLVESGTSVKIQLSQNSFTTFTKNSTTGEYTSTDENSQYDKLVKTTTESTLTKKDGSKWIFINNYLSKKISKTGQETLISRNANNNVTQIKDVATSKHLGVEYTQDTNYISRIYDNAGREVNFEYTENKLTKITDPNGNITTYTYDSNGKILSSKDTEENVLFVNTYDDQGRVIKQENNGTTLFTYLFDSENQWQITEVTNRLGAIKKLYHSTNFKLIKVVDENNASKENNYNFNSTLNSETDENGNKTQYFYDSRENVIKTIDAKGNETLLTYDTSDNITSITNSGDNRGTFTYTNKLLTESKDKFGNITTYQYNESNQLATQTAPNGGITTYTYENGLLKTTTDPEGTTLTYEHDTLGRVTATLDENGNRTELTYDNNNNILTTKNALNETTSFEYDSKNRKIAEKDAKGNKTAYAYDYNNNLLSTTNSLNQTITNEYNAEDRLIKTTDFKGNSTQLVYDEKGQITAVTDSLGNSISTAYDKVGNSVSTIDAYGTKIQETEYDALNLPTKVTDALNNSTLFTYNQWSDITETTNVLTQTKKYTYHDIGKVSTVTDALDGVTSQAYDNMGQRTSFTDANGNVTKFTYDLAGRTTSVELQAGQKVNYEYNNLGQLSKTTNSRGHQFTYEYNELGELTKTTKPEGAIDSTYDANGNILTKTDENGTVSYEYDALNRPILYTDVYGNILSYVYDENSNLTQLIYPDGKILDYTYDVLNQLTGVKDWNNNTTAYEYDKNSRLVKTTRPNGTYETRTYDIKGQMLATKDHKPDGTIIHEDNFAYNGVGNITSEDVQKSIDVNNKKYTYDNLNRVTNVTVNTDKQFNYVYDKQGNITSVTATAQDPLNLTYGANNWLTKVNETDITYDADGNAQNTVLNGTATNLTYDSMNRLLSSEGVTYKYDVNNTRIGITENGTETRFVVNPLSQYSQLLMETDATGNVTKRYVYGLGLISEETADNNYKTYHYDYRGSTVALTDSLGELTKEFEYAPYGELLSPQDGTRFLYNGRDGVQTDNNGLYYMRARYYNTDIKRFINQDVLLGGIEDSTSLNRYSYVNGNPISLVDPFGLEALQALGVAKEVLSYVPFIGSAISAYDAVSAFSKGNIAEGLMYSAFMIPGAGNLAKAGKVAKYTVGSYKDLTKIARGSGLDAHHVGQKAIMKKFIKGYDEKTAPSILVPVIGHRIRVDDITKILSRSSKGITNPRQLIARDIAELRRVYPDIPNSALKELIKMNKDMYPEMRR
jgi:RHS repeat-associated protein